MLRFAHLEFQVFIGQVLGLSVLSLELTKTHCLLNGVLDVNLGFIILPLVHALCRINNIMLLSVGFSRNCLACICEVSREHDVPLIVLMIMM